MSRNQLQRLLGKVAVVTGGASGIGEAAVRRFVKEGARVVIADIQESLGNKLAQDMGAATLFVHTDVRKEQDVAAAVDAAFALEGRVDIMVSNAGIVGAIGGIEELDMEEYHYTLAVNLTGAVLGVKHAVRVMKPAKHGAIICTGSTASVLAGIGPHCYTISKSAMVGLVKSAAVELSNYGIRINMVSPHSVSTPLLATALESLSTHLTLPSQDAHKLPQAPHFTTDQVADAVTFLASAESACITGHNLLLDGGYTSSGLIKGVEHWFQGKLPFIREAGIRKLA